MTGLSPKGSSLIQWPMARELGGIPRPMTFGHECAKCHGCHGDLVFRPGAVLVLDGLEPAEPHQPRLFRKPHGIAPGRRRGGSACHQGMVGFRRDVADFLDEGAAVGRGEVGG